MLLPLILTSALLLSALAAFAVVLRKIHTGNVAADDDVRQDFSVERYRPMFRLLDESDCEFIHSGFPRRAQLLRHFRAERRSLFRVYLHDLAADHTRIVRAMRNLLVESNLDRPDLAKALYRCQFMFGLAMVSIEFSLLRHAMGIGTVDVRSLFSAVEGLQLQLQDMAFVQAVGYGQ
jgi:hypothetical protein